MFVFQYIFQNFNRTTSKQCNMKIHLLIWHIHALHAYTCGTTAQFTTHTETIYIYIRIFFKNKICHLAHKKKCDFYCRLSFIFTLAVFRWKVTIYF